MHVWISRFRCPVTIATDQGTNFQLNLFRELTRSLDCNKIPSAAYHLQANGIIERLHRQFKSAVKACNQIKWAKILPTVLLGLLSNGHSGYQFTTYLWFHLTITSDLAVCGSIDQTPNSIHAINLIQAIKSLNPVSTAHHCCSKIMSSPDSKLVPIFS
ncbi:pro-Pol polyprotein [Nephila pilipes]|uniref:Pro-Pol polyprotein n=1 Tax=Nephila pilipes TaxID=299642 RepID=A0A8X6NIN6_NEPPI|nr:pro-Pol polyprotein [Nephila pilipes]